MPREFSFFAAGLTSEQRLQVVKDSFHPDIVWFDFDGSIMRGHRALFDRAELLLGQLPVGSVHRLRGQPSMSQNVVTQKWDAVPAGTDNDFDQVPMIEGRDIVLIDDHQIKILWTCVDYIDEDKLGSGIGKA